MKVHIIYNPNRKGPEVRVHKAGCRDIQRDIEPTRDRPAATSDYATEGPSQRAIAIDWWADFIEEGSMTRADAVSYTEFLPCTKGLPERTDRAALIADFIERHGYTVENSLQVYAQRMREVAVLAVPSHARAFIEAAEKAEAAAAAWSPIFEPTEENE